MMIMQLVLSLLLLVEQLAVIFTGQLLIIGRSLGFGLGYKLDTVQIARCKTLYQYWQPQLLNGLLPVDRRCTHSNDSTCDCFLVDVSTLAESSWNQIGYVVHCCVCAVGANGRQSLPAVMIGLSQQDSILQPEW
jgi:hypothetical protein